MSILDTTEIQIGEVTYRLNRYHRFISIHEKRPGQVYKRVMHESMSGMRELIEAISSEIEKDENK